MSSKFREHLSISLPTTNLDIHNSQFSPGSLYSDTAIPSRLSISSKSIMRDSAVKDIEAGIRPPPPGGARDRFTKLFFDIRTLGQEPEVEHHPLALQQWPPLQVEKRRCNCHEASEKQRRHSRWCLIILIIILLLLLGNTIFLNVKVLSMPNTIGSNSGTTSTNTSIMLSTNAQQCLSQYTLNAPSDPTGYPCSTCLSTLQGVPSSFDGTQDGQQIQNAIQFCGLRAIFETANAAGQAALGNQSWVRDVKFCAWAGVTCNGSGQVSNLKLTFPGVPATLPSEIGSLTGLQSLQVVGGNSIPAGALPSSFTNLTSINNLHLEATAITSLPDTIFQSMKAVTTLTLVNNKNMGTSLPSSLTLLSLQNLVVNSQQLTNPLSTLSSASTLQSSLQLLDLSTTSLNGTIPPSISSLSALTQLVLSSNNLRPPLPPTFPLSLRLINLQNNIALTGTVPSSLCKSSSLKTCSFQNTGLNATGGCGPCQF